MAGSQSVLAGCKAPGESLGIRVTVETVLGYLPSNKAAKLIPCKT